MLRIRTGGHGCGLRLVAVLVLFLVPGIILVGPRVCHVSAAETRSAKPMALGLPETSSRPASAAEEAGDGERRLVWVAERAIEAAERTLTVVLWLLGILVSGTAVGVFALYRRISTFLRNAKEELEAAVDSLRENSLMYEQLMRNLPLLLVPAVDDEARAVALNTLAQLRRPELRPLFTQSLRDNASCEVRRAAAYAIGLLNEAGRESVCDLVVASRSSDPLLRRACATALIALGPLCRESEERLEEMRGDADTVVQRMATDGLARLRAQLVSDRP